MRGLNKSIAIIGMTIFIVAILGLMGSNPGSEFPLFNEAQLELLITLMFLAIPLIIVGVVFD